MSSEFSLIRLPCTLAYPFLFLRISGTIYPSIHSATIRYKSHSDDVGRAEPQNHQRGAGSVSTMSRVVFLGFLTAPTRFQTIVGYKHISNGPG